MKSFPKGATDRSILVFLQDSSATDGSGNTGLVAADLSIDYTRVEDDNDVVTTSINLSDLSALTDAHSDGGIIETSIAGLYRLDVPDGAWATGASLVVISIQDVGTGNNVAPAFVEVQLDDYDNAADAVWDEDVSKNEHNVANSAGRYLRNIKQVLSSKEGTVNDLGATTTVFDTDLTEADDFWNNLVLVFTSGNLAGQARPILDYANASGQITLDKPLTEAPANNDEFVILATHVHPVSDIRDSVWSQTIETGLSAKQALAVIAAAECGKLSGAATTTITIKAAEEGSTTRITATVDEDGNRSAVTLTLP